MDLALRAVAAADDGPSLSRYIEREATVEQLLEFVVHRSAYQLKEADPHSWALPRLHGGPKAALVQIQADEYGNGDPARIHAQLFADAMDALGLDPRYGAYIDQLPGSTLATVNLMSLFGLHRRWRGAIVGHLALFEMESSLPNRRYADGLRRLGYGECRDGVLRRARDRRCDPRERRRGRPRRRPRAPAAGARPRHPVGRRGAGRARCPRGAPDAERLGRRPQLAAQRAGALRSELSAGTPSAAAS